MRDDATDEREIRSHTRSHVASDFMSGTDCVEADGTDLTAVDPDTPAADQVTYYLVRCENDCPQGEGTLGLGLDQAQRIGRLCP